MKNQTFLISFLVATFASSISLADDCDSIRQALKDLPPAGGEVIIPKKNGPYNCSSPLVIDRSNVVLRGEVETKESQDRVTLRLADHSHAPMIIIGEPKTIKDQNGNYVPGYYRNNNPNDPVPVRVENIEISNLTLDGNLKNHDPKRECGETTCDNNAASVRNNGITIRGASKVLIKNVTAHHMISGGMVTEKYCDRLTVHDFESYGNYFDGFAGYETTNSLFYRMKLHHNQGAGISIDINFNNNVLRDSDLTDNAKVGIFARNLRENKFIRLNILRSGEHGAFLANAEHPNTCANNNLFDSLKITGSKGAAIQINDDCFGNVVVASNLCGNAQGELKENKVGTSLVQDPIKCR